MSYAAISPSANGGYFTWHYCPDCDLTRQSGSGGSEDEPHCWTCDKPMVYIAQVIPRNGVMSMDKFQALHKAIMEVCRDE